jgi:UDPglucose 6-dehydrogenase
MKLSVVGAGYVGLTTAACLAQIGHDVFCGENDPDKLAKLRAGEMPIFEPHLENVIKRVSHANRLRFGSTEESVQWGDAIFICVGTPPLANGDADLQAIESVARTIAKRASGNRVIIEKSTVPVQTGAQLRRHLAVHQMRGFRHEVASNPEFLREGASVEDFLHPERIVIGVESERATEILREIYGPILRQEFSCPVHSNCPKVTNPTFLVTDTNSAELIKHASNSFLAMKISFINMVADLCELVGADIGLVAQGMGLDSRIGPAFLNPGIGFGGFCFPKDVQAFIRIAEKSGCDFSLLKEVEKINQSRIQYFVEKVRKELWVIGGKQIALWGLAFKPNTDDVRFSPSIELAQRLLNEGAAIRAYDPQAMQRSKPLLPGVQYCADPYEAADGADAIVIATEWDEFRKIDWDRVRSVVVRPLVVDGRNMFDAADLARRGFDYISTGRLPTKAGQLPSMVLEASSVSSVAGPSATGTVVQPRAGN